MAPCHITIVIGDKATSWSLLEREKGRERDGERAREDMMGGVELMGRDGSQIRERSV